MNYDDYRAAVKANPRNLAHVPSTLLDDALVEYALSHHPGAIGEVPQRFLTDARVLNAVRVNGLALAKVPDSSRTLAVCIAAVRQNRSAIEYVHPDILCEALLAFDESVEADEALDAEATSVQSGKLDLATITDLESYRCSASLENGLLTLEDGTYVDMLDIQSQLMELAGIRQADTGEPGNTARDVAYDDYGNAVLIDREVHSTEHGEPDGNASVWGMQVVEIGSDRLEVKMFKLGGDEDADGSGLSVLMEVASGVPSAHIYPGTQDREVAQSVYSLPDGTLGVRPGSTEQTYLDHDWLPSQLQGSKTDRQRGS